MKKSYIKPQLEVYSYKAEEGYTVSVGLTRHRDYIIIQGTDRTDLRAADEVTEYTDAYGEWDAAGWE